MPCARRVAVVAADDAGVAAAELGHEVVRLAVAAAAHVGREEVRAGRGRQRRHRALALEESRVRNELAQPPRQVRSTNFGNKLTVRNVVNVIVTCVRL